MCKNVILFVIFTPGSKESVEKHHDLPVVSQEKVAFGKKERTYFYVLHDSVKVHGMPQMLILPFQI